MPRSDALFEIWFELLDKFGIREVSINLNAHAPAVREFVANRFANIRIKISHERELLGSAGTLAANRDRIGKDSSFLGFLLGRSYKRQSWANAPIPQKPSERCDSRRLSRASPEPGNCRCEQAGRVERFVEKPDHPPGDLAFAGILIGTQRLSDVPQKCPADIGFDVLPELAG